MRYRLIVAGVLMTSLLGSNIAAAEKPPRPLKCPSGASLRATGVSRNTLKIYNAWIAGRRNVTGNTVDHWTWFVGNINAPDAEKAYNIAVEAIETLTFQTGPLEGPYDKWYCLYNTAGGYPAITINPNVATFFAAAPFVNLM